MVKQIQRHIYVCLYVLLLIRQQQDLASLVKIHNMVYTCYGWFMGRRIVPSAVNKEPPLMPGYGLVMIGGSIPQRAEEVTLDGD